MPRRRRKPHPQGPGYMLRPHGPNPWHFQEEALQGNGQNGRIGHLWRPQIPIPFPGRGVHHG